MITEGFHHVAHVTADPARAAAFYGGALGLRELPPGAGGEADPGAPLLFGDEGGAPGTRVALLPARGAGAGRPGIGGSHHTAFGVDDEESLLRWKRRLTDLGLAVSGPYDRGYFTSIYFRDLDGQVLEIATAGPGYAIDEPVDRLGGELTIPPRRIVRGHRDEAAIAALTHPEPVPEITPAMALRGIHHVSGITDDLERAGEFLEAGLGLRLIKRTTNRDDPGQLHYFWARLVDGEVAPHSSFTLFGWPSGWHRARAGVGQTSSVAFRARDHAELDAWADHLRALGHPVGTAEARGPFDVLGTEAPDGFRVELAADRPASGEGA